MYTISDEFIFQLYQPGQIPTGSVLIVAIIPGMKETYHNVKLLQLGDLQMDYINAMDLKLANIAGGIQAHGSTFPCLWCACPKAEFAGPRSQTYPLRSLGSVRRNAESY